MFKHLRIARYELKLRALSAVGLPPFAGSTLRGAFGATFKRMVCVERRGECPACLLRKQCAYPYIFETWIESGEGARQEVARPFVIEPPFGRMNAKAEGRSQKDVKSDGGFILQPSDEVRFSLLLFGRAIDYLPYFILTFREAAERGLGASRGQCHLTLVEAVHPLTGQREDVFNETTGALKDLDFSVAGSEITQAATVKEAGGEDAHTTDPRLSIQFQTYTRLVFHNQLVDRVEFHVLIARLLQRLETLVAVHGDAEPATDARDLIINARKVRLVEGDHHWVDWDRYSCRQGRRITMGGVLGGAVYTCDDAALLRQYLPLLKLGELTHVGKGCVFGMGKIAATWM